MAIDVERLLAEALTKHGIRLDPHDPAIVLVTLNRLVLEDAVDLAGFDEEFHAFVGGGGAVDVE